MRDTISDHKWYYILFGLFGIAFMILPMVKTDGLNLVLFNYETGFKYVLGMVILFPLLLVLTNALYGGVYKEDYYERIHKIMAIVLPIAGILILLTLKSGLTEFDLTNSSYTVFYYLVYAYICLFYAFHIYICFFKTY